MLNWKNFWVFFTTGIPSVVLYPLLLLSSLVLAVGLLSKRVNNKSRYTLWVLLVVYLSVLICSTVICREVVVFDFDRLQLIPFWTYKAVVHHMPGVSVWDIVLNVALFMPLGFLVKLIYPTIQTGKILLIALGCSVFIEVNQYYWEKGAVQIDDVMHNTIGAVLGWLLAKGILLLLNTFYTHKNH